MNKLSVQSTSKGAYCHVAVHSSCPHHLLAQQSPKVVYTCVGAAISIAVLACSSS
jgi:hypothetical protein